MTLERVAPGEVDLALRFAADLTQQHGLLAGHSEIADQVECLEDEPALAIAESQPDPHTAPAPDWISPILMVHRRDWIVAGGTTSGYRFTRDDRQRWR